LWDAHAVAPIPGGALIAIDRLFLHERMGSVALQALAAAGRKVADPARVFATMDHIVDTRPGRTGTLVAGGDAFLDATRRMTHAAGIRLFDIGDPHQGIVHVIGPELGLALPGSTIVCPDSHTCSQGALGAFAWGIGSSEAEHAMATGTIRMQRPRTMRITVSGRLGATAKDLALHIIAEHGADGGQCFAVEYAGDTVRAMDIEARLTLCNMATEFGAVTATIAPDDAVFDWLRGRDYAPKGATWDRAVAAWRTLASGEGATFDREIAVDAAAVAPMISWGTSPEESAAFGTPAGTSAYMDVADTVEGLTIDAAFIGSCTNGRLSDLRRAAALLVDRHVATGVRALVVPGSSAVKRDAEAEGLDRVFIAAGFEWRESGCAMCFNAGGETFPPGSRVVSSTNRNFEGRQGPGVRTHIASPETVAASAVMGRITDPRRFAA
jgi:3-isopropylmalate/(R)-2-methylmalate dehydratase large subunit